MISTSSKTHLAPSFLGSRAASLEQSGPLPSEPIQEPALAPLRRGHSEPGCDYEGGGGEGLGGGDESVGGGGEGHASLVHT
jgi:hypothetical protein